MRGSGVGGIAFELLAGIAAVDVDGEYVDGAQAAANAISAIAGRNDILPDVNPGRLGLLKIIVGSSERDVFRYWGVSVLKTIAASIFCIRSISVV
jgi:hypothetical protein